MSYLSDLRDGVFYLSPFLIFEALALIFLLKVQIGILEGIDAVLVYISFVMSIVIATILFATSPKTAYLTRSFFKTVNSILSRGMRTDDDSPDGLIFLSLILIFFALLFGYPNVPSTVPKIIYILVPYFIQNIILSLSLFMTSEGSNLARFGSLVILSGILAPIGIVLLLLYGKQAKRNHIMFDVIGLPRNTEAKITVENKEYSVDNYGVDIPVSNSVYWEADYVKDSDLHTYVPLRLNGVAKPGDRVLIVYFRVD
ncbi:hypothetical protein EWF20_02220 [Sulfolobus sp. S-194]|uniref:hypothetical protein n=1 Tax=Sulfolobus sp. S-194 TaxID=2512240 RepID=UPI0014371094|nr:hypothetical protein [Sulfolobus sp. S-194]QIW23087.1 hypothetical protein EWF20_02220 [Sulfolobus sp. S-194]